jgi:hypothetical protein
MSWWDVQKISNLSDFEEIWFDLNQFERKPKKGFQERKRTFIFIVI